MHDIPHEALLNGQRRPLCIRLTGTIGGAQTQGGVVRVHEHQGTDFGAHESGGLAHDALQDLIQVEAGTNVLANVDQGDFAVRAAEKATDLFERPLRRR